MATSRDGPRRATKGEARGGKFAAVPGELLESIADAFYAVDHDWRFIYVNRRAEACWGERRERLIGRVLWDVFPRLLGTVAERELRRAAHERRPVEYEMLSVIGGHWIGVSACPGARGLSVQFRDISERKRLDEALRCSEESFRALAEAAVEGVALHDPDRFLVANSRFAQMFGYAPDEVVGRHPLAFVAPEARAEVIARAERGDDGPCETLALRKDGTTFPAAFSGRAIPYQGRTVRAVVVQDITERRRIEAERRRAEAAFRQERAFSELVIDSTVEGICAIDRRFRVTLWNKGLEEMTGLSRRHARGKPIFEVFPSTSAAPVETPWRDALDGRVTLIEEGAYTVPETNRSGSYDCHFSPLYAPDQSIIGAIAFARDTTERRRLEEQMQRGKRLEAIGQLTGGVAHDFNNLLTIIGGNLDLLARRLPDDPRLRDLVTAGQHAAERGGHLTQQLLTFARRQTLHPEVLNINTVLLDMDMLIRRAASDVVRVTLAFEDELWPCRADAAQLEAAILNIVINARDAMPEGGLLKVTTRNLSLARDEGELAAGNYVLLEIGDTGCGMAPAVLARAFEPFFTTKELGKGTGLGLSMIYGFARQSGGTVRIDTVPSAGTTVRLYLPHAPEEIAAVGAPAPADLAVGHGTVLVVEDDAGVREIAASTLDELGYRVLFAASGEEAMTLLEKAAVDLLFSDIVMPGGVSGVELAKHARRRYPRMKVLLTSGYTAEHLDGAGVEGCTFLPKPYKPMQLAAAVRRLLDPVASQS